MRTISNIAYGIVGTGIIGFGIWCVILDLREPDGFLDGLGALVAYTFVVTGALHHLNLAYGMACRGLRFVALAANTGLLVIIGLWALEGWWGFLIFGLLACASLLGFLDRPAPARPVRPVLEAGAG